MPANVRETHLYELICRIRARTVFVKRASGTRKIVDQLIEVLVGEAEAQSSRSPEWVFNPANQSRMKIQI